MAVTIYHNPSCGTSRNTLAMIRHSGKVPEIIEYLKTPPQRARSSSCARCACARASCCAARVPL